MKKIVSLILAVTLTLTLFTILTTASASTASASNANITVTIDDLTDRYLAYSENGCVGWRKNEIGELEPGHIAIGDVSVNGQKHYDIGGSGESTIVINLSSESVVIQANWGAGEKVLTNNEASFKLLKAQLAFEEFSQTETDKNGDSRYKYDAVRFVIINGDGDITLPEDDEIITFADFFTNITR